jgi:hypothetical protein
VPIRALILREGPGPEKVARFREPAADGRRLTVLSRRRRRPFAREAAREAHGAAGRPDVPPQLERRQTARLDRVTA